MYFTIILTLIASLSLAALCLIYSHRNFRRWLVLTDRSSGPLIKKTGHWITEDPIEVPRHGLACYYRASIQSLVRGQGKTSQIGWKEWSSFQLGEEFSLVTREQELVDIELLGEVTFEHNEKFVSSVLVKNLDSTQIELFSEHFDERFDLEAKNSQYRISEVWIPQGAEGFLVGRIDFDESLEKPDPILSALIYKATGRPVMGLLKTGFAKSLDLFIASADEHLTTRFIFRRWVFLAFVGFGLVLAALILIKRLF